LFEALSSKASTKVLADDLISRFNQNGDGANNVTVQLLNLIFRCSGMPSGISSTSQVLDEDDEDSYNVSKELKIDGGLLMKLQKETSSSYPAAERNAVYRNFSKRLKDFWSKLVNACCSGTKPDVSVEHGLLDTMVSQLEVVCHSAGHPFRHASVQSMTFLVSALGNKIRHVDDQLDQIQKKVNAEIKKSKTNKPSKTTQKNLEVLQDKRFNMSSLIEDMMGTVYKHRYRDTFADIRVSIAAALRKWIIVNPKYFTTNDFLKYFAWMLNDRSHLVRAEVLSGIESLFELENGTNLNSAFTKRFFPRFFEMIKDVSFFFCIACFF